jgi:hypothetical protein
MSNGRDGNHSASSKSNVGVCQMKLHVAAGIAALAFAIPWFVACSGGGARTEVRATSVTTGEQLTDLKKAYDQGVITQSEYEKKRREILAQ